MNDKHFEKIMFKSSYGLNEGVKYNKIDSSYFDNDDDFDIIGEDESEEDNEELENDEELGINNSEEDNVDNTEEISLDDNSKQEVDTTEKNHDLVQNQIIKNTINTMNMIHDKMKELENSVNVLNNEYTKLKSDVEEVKEPSNMEKLTQHKEDSFPYYKNLNDIWKSDGKGNAVNDEGIIKLKNGTYISIFDDLDNMSSTQIEKSFYTYD
jgi:hypothetical protein